MRKVVLHIVFFLCIASHCYTLQGQKRTKEDKDTSDYISQVIELSPLILHSKIDVKKLIDKLRKDTTFYKAFKNLNITNYLAAINGTMYNKREKVQGVIRSQIEQLVAKDCVTKKTVKEYTKGPIRNRKGEWNFLTCKMFGNFFLDTGQECNKSNIISRNQGSPFSVKGKQGLEKTIEQVKILIFNPGQRVPEFFYFGNKVALFDKHIAKLYNYSIDHTEYKGRNCILFTIKAKKDLNIFQQPNIVIDELVTWIDEKTWEIVSRNYSLSYNLGLVKFFIYMDVEISRFQDYSIPTTVRYKGNWSVPFYKNESGIFSVQITPLPPEK